MTLRFFTEANDANTKLDFLAGGSYGFTGNIGVNNLWVTASAGDGGVLYTLEDASLRAGTVYVDGGQLWFRYSGATEEEPLNTNFRLGTSRREGEADAGALRISQNVRINGELTAEENATVLFSKNNADDEGSTLTVKQLGGPGVLTVRSADGSRGHVLEVRDMGGGHTGTTLKVEKGITLRINAPAGNWGGFSGQVDIDGDLEFASGEFNCIGNVNVNGGLTANPDTDNRICIMNNATLTLAPHAGESSIGGLDIRDRGNTANVLRNITLYRYGIYCNQGDGGTFNVGDAENNVTVSVSLSDWAQEYRGPVNVHAGSTVETIGRNVQKLKGAITGAGDFVASAGELELSATGDPNTVSDAGAFGANGDGRLTVLRSFILTGKGFIGDGGTINLGDAVTRIEVVLDGAKGGEFAGTLNVAQGSTLRLESGSSVTLSGTVNVSDLTINESRMVLSGAGTSEIASLRGEGGELLVSGSIRTDEETGETQVLGHTLTLGSPDALDEEGMARTTFNGNVGVAKGGTLVLASEEIVVKGLSTLSGLAEAEGTYSGTVKAQRGAATLIIEGGAGETGEANAANGITFDAGVNIVKSGDGEQRMRNVTINGLLMLTEGVLNFDGGASAIAGELTGTGGMLRVSGRGTTLALNGGAELEGDLSVTGGAAVELGSDVKVSNLRADADTNNKITGAGVLEVHVPENHVVSGVGAEASLTLTGAEATLKKTGAGIWNVGGLSSQNGAKVILDEGRMQYVGGNFNVGNLVFTGGDISVSTAAELAKSCIARVGTLTVETRQPANEEDEPVENRVHWRSDASGGVQGLFVTTLTGSGTLNFGNLGEGSPNTAAVHNEVQVQSLRNFNGAITGTTEGMSRVYLGSYYLSGSEYFVRELRMDAGYEARIEVQGGVFSKAFRKTGAGSLSISELTVENVEGGGLWMDYEGDLTIDKLTVGNGVVLHYTRGEEERQIRLSVDELYKTDLSYGVDVVNLEDTGKLATGVSLGITSRDGSEDLELLHSKITPWRADGMEYELNWRKSAVSDDYVLYMNVLRYPNPENNWDPDWGAVTQLAPTKNEMETKRQITAEDVESLSRTDCSSFLRNTLMLSSNGETYYNPTFGWLILISDGPTLPSTDSWATVMGGASYVTGEAIRLESNSWIILRPKQEGVNYHMLVGGSSCFTSDAPINGRVGGYVGNTHIQMQGGNVDYIVGGNHLTNTAFVFEGLSYISVFGGKVSGSVVGGSTITTGATGAYKVHEFSGETRIAIHSVLSNDAQTPKISAPADQSGHNVGAAFTAIVGGNAWVGVPESADVGDLNPSFKGRSSILVDFITPVDEEIQRGATKGNFDKAIVGGNYTAYTNAKDGSTIFSAADGVVGATSNVTIRAKEDAVFTAGVNGASRRASDGAGSTIYRGSTSVSLAGGTYSEAVAGGFWFESTAKGDHRAELTGDTRVSVSDGQVWRVVGGDYWLGGGADSGSLHTGSSSVDISGGSFGSVSKRTDAIVAGGSYYRNSAGSQYLQEEGTAGVNVSGGKFEGVTLIGGDYADASASKTFASTINGGSYVHIAAAEKGATISLRGLVAGGSYLTDTASGGSVSTAVDSTRTAYATEVTVGEGAAVVSEGVAVVAGSVIADSGTGGAHSATITGDTHLQVSGGSVKGHLVGGSYTLASKAGNELSISGASHIELTGGAVEGSVYGGHYSANTRVLDTMAMGGADITLDGATVQGNIVGGHYRNTVDEQTAAPMGAVEISLLSGRLEGEVYAAGWHGATNSKSLKYSTAATTVRVSAEVQFGAEVQPQAEDDAPLTTLIVSGGFYKAAANDVSTVTGAATLVFDNSKGEDFANIGSVAFRDFDTVALDSDLTLAKDQLRVMNRGRNTSLTKAGEGVLTLEGGLSDAEGKTYTGRIWVNDGILALGANQSLNAGIGFNLSGRAHLRINDKATAYLQAVDGAKLTAKAGTPVALAGQDLPTGFFYLTGEISGLAAGAKAEDVFTLDKEGSSLEWTRSDDYKYELLLKDNCLVLRVHRYDPDKWIWEGDGDGVWSNNSTKNWTREGVTKLLPTEDVIFDAGAMSMDVTVKGTVTPRNIYVDGGDYTFTAKDASSNIKMAKDGLLYIGTDSPDRDANLTLRLSNNEIPGVVLKEGGKLILGAAGALPTAAKLWFNGGVLAYGEDEESGSLYMRADMSDKVQADSTGPVRLQVGRTDVAEANTRKVTWGSEDDLHTGTGANEGIRRILEVGLEKTGRAALEVIWKESGSQPVAPYAGTLDVLGGTLTMTVAAEELAGNIVYGGKSDIRVAKGATLQFTSLSDKSSLSAARVDIARNLVSVDAAVPEAEAPATVVIGSSAVDPANQLNYRLSGDNSNFEGNLELRGREDSMSDSVRVKNAKALGGSEATEGKNTTLTLAGRHIVMEAGKNPTVINAAEVHVKKGTVNYLGYALGEEGDFANGVPGIIWNKSNQSITLTGKLTGSGVIANARGITNSASKIGQQSPFTHTISGDISEFTGTIVAGSYKAVKGEGTGESSAKFPLVSYSGSSWELTGETAPEVVHASFAGLGSIIFSYAGVGEKGKVLIDGNIGTDKAENGVGNSVRIENRMSGTLIIGGSNNLSEGGLIFNRNIIQLGDKDHAATWSGNKLYDGGLKKGTEESAFVLANGTLQEAFTKSSKGAIQLRVDTAPGAQVRVAKTAGTVFDEIAVHYGGRLLDVKGDIIAGTGKGNTTRLVLGFDKDSVDDAPGSVPDYLINSSGGNMDLTQAALSEDVRFEFDYGADMEVEFDNDALINVLMRHRDSGAKTYLHVLAGGGEIIVGSNFAADFTNLFGGGSSNTAILGGLGFKCMGVEQGDIIMSGSSKEVYLVLGSEDEWRGDSHDVGAYDVLHTYKATVVDSGQTLTVHVPNLKSASLKTKPRLDKDGAHINNLVGLENSTLSLQNDSQAEYLRAMEEWDQEYAVWSTLSDAEKQQSPLSARPAYEGDVTYVLSNALRVVLDDWALPDGVEPEALKGIDTYFEGTILADEGANIRKTGSGTLHVGMEGGTGGLQMTGEYYLSMESTTVESIFGGVQAASEYTPGEMKLTVRGGELRLEEGGLSLRGEGSAIGSFIFAYATDPAGPEEDRALTVSGCTLSITNNLSDEGERTVDDAIRLENGAELIYSGVESELHNISISSDTKDGWFSVERVEHEDITGVNRIEVYEEELEEAPEEADPAAGEPGNAKADTEKRLVQVVYEDITMADPRVGKLTMENATVTNVNLRVTEGELHFMGASTIKSAEVKVEDGVLTLRDDSSLRTDKLHVGGTGLVDLSSTTGNSVRELTGEGTLQGAEGGELTYVGDRSSTFAGKLAGTESKGAKLTINSGLGTLTFRNVESDPAAKWDIENYGNWTVDASKDTSVSGPSVYELAMKTGHLLLGAESKTCFIYNPNIDRGAFNTDTVEWQKGAEITIRSSSDEALRERKVLLGRVYGMAAEDLRRSTDRRDVEISLRGLPYLHYAPGEIQYFESELEGQKIYLTLNHIEGNVFAHNAQHKNARAGAELFNAVTEDPTAYADIISDTSTDIYKMSNALANMLDEVEAGRGSRAQLDRTLAAGAGAATAVLGSALSRDVERQLQNIRNRTTTMSPDPAYDRYSEKPLYHVWLNAEGNYHKLKADDLAPGFTLNSWGGTLGMDLAYNRTTSVGVALTAMYGDLKTDSADNAKGDLDTTYISLFARKAHGAWLHTLVMTAGLADVTLNRTVDYGEGSYSTTGSTDGNTVGALYEIGYSKAMRADGSAVLQAVLNAEVRHTQINGYTERSSDAGLQVGDIEQTIITFGAGVRTQAAIGTSALNRTAILEGRVLAKCDVGDRSGTANTKLIRGTAATVEVESAELGVMGLELGAGVTIPIGVQGSIYADASAELRSGYTSVNANVGYRVSF